MTMLNKRQRVALRTFLFKKDNTRPFLRLRQTDEVKLFNTIHECAAFLSVHPEVVWEAFLASQPLQGWSITHVKHNDVEATYAKLYWTTIRQLPPGQTNIRRKRPVKMFDIYTKEVQAFPTLYSAGKSIGIKTSHLRARISLPEKVRLLYERYVVVDAEHNFDFLTEEKRQAIFESIKWGVIVFDTRKRTVQRFSGLTAYLRLMNKMGWIENARRLLHNKGIYHVDQYRFLMVATYKMNEKTQDELRQLFIDKINRTLFYFR